MSVTIIKDTIFNSNEDYIAHQCNCVSITSKGLAMLIFEKYPFANTYINRKGIPSVLGSIDAWKTNSNQPGIINMYSQYYPGKSQFDNDSKEIRLLSFQKCLNYIKEIPYIKSIAFPYNIACGLAGGNWEDYLSLIIQFAQENNINVTIYKNI